MPNDASSPRHYSPPSRSEPTPRFPVETEANLHLSFM